MIYGDLILENNIKEMTNPIKIIQEYYENEISFLNSTIDYQNEYAVTESVELETLHEGFIQNTINKIKELFKNFIEWLKKIWSNFTSLFKSKVNNAEKTVKKGEEAIKSVEHRQDLSKEEKEEKKLSIAHKFTKSNSDSSNDNSSSNVSKDKKYRFYFIEPNSIMRLLFRTEYAANVDDLIDDFNDDESFVNMKYMNIIDKKMSNVKSMSLDDIWEEFSKKYYYSPTLMTPEEILQQTNKNLENYKNVQDLLEKRKVSIDRNNKGLEKIINKFPKDIKQENLNKLYSILNKYISANEREFSIAVAFVNKLGSNLKVVEVED